MICLMTSKQKDIHLYKYFSNISIEKAVSNHEKMHQIKVWFTFKMVTQLMKRPVHIF